MAVRKKKTVKKTKAKKAPAKKTKKRVAAKAVAKKAAKKTSKKTKAKTKKTVKAKAAKRPAAKKAVKKAKKKTTRRGEYGEGNYKASKRFRTAEEGFIAKNRSKIPGMAKAAEAALEGPEGDELRAAEASTAAHGAGQPEE